MGSLGQNSRSQSQLRVFEQRAARVSWWVAVNETLGPRSRQPPSKDSKQKPPRLIHHEASNREILRDEFTYACVGSVGNEVNL